MKDKHEHDLKELHILLKQVFFDYLERMKIEGIDEADVNKVGNAFGNNDLEIKITTLFTNQQMHLTGSVDGQTYFQAALNIENVTFQ